MIIYKTPAPSTVTLQVEPDRNGHHNNDREFLAANAEKYGFFQIGKTGIYSFAAPFGAHQEDEGWERTQAARNARVAFYNAYYATNRVQFDRENERILGALVESSVLCCMSGIVEFCLASENPDSPYQWKDAENLTTETVLPDQWRPVFDGVVWTYNRIDEDGDDEEMFTASIDAIRAQFPDLDEDEYPEHEAVITCLDLAGKKYATPDRILDEYEDPETEEETAEPCEFWAIDDRFYRWLKDAGELVWDGSPQIWGRQTSGQAISLDGVIWRIAREHGILYGQDRQW